MNRNYYKIVGAYNIHPVLRYEEQQSYRLNIILIESRSKRSGQKQKQPPDIMTNSELGRMQSQFYRYLSEYILSKFITQQIRNKVNLSMHLANQPNKQIYYFPQCHVNPGMAVQFSHAHPPMHTVHRVEVSHRVKSELEVRQNKGAMNLSEHEQLTFRKDLGKNNTLQNEIPTSRYFHYQSQNVENVGTSTVRSVPVTPQDTAIRNKSLLHIKRKDTSSSGNAKQVRDQYYKGQQTSYMDELMNKLPQLDLQPLNKNISSRQSHASPPVDCKHKQIKKVTSPFMINSKNVTVKDYSSSENLHPKIFESGIFEQTKRRDSNKNSPIKNHQMVIKSLRQIEKIAPNPENNETSRCMTRKESLAETSNTTSTLFESSDKFSPSSSTFFKFLSSSNFENKSLKCVNSQCQTDQNDADKTQIAKLKTLIAKAQKQLEDEKIINHQKQVKIKNLEHDLTSLKIKFEKDTLILQNQLSAKRQADIIEVRETFEKQLANFIADIKLKSSQQIKRAQNQYKIDYDLKFKEFELSIEQLRKEKFEIEQKLSEETKISSNLLNEIQLSQESKIKIEQKVLILSAANEKMLQHMQRLQSKKETDCWTTQTDQIPVEISPQTQRLKQKMSIVQQKLSICQSSLDKQTQRLRETRQQLDKSQRKIDELNCNCRNMGRDIKGRDKHIAELSKQNACYSKLIQEACQQRIRTECASHNQKYRKMAEMEI